MKRLIAVPVGVCLLIAGCGSDNSSNEQTTEAKTTAEAPAAPTRAEYIAEADALCKKTNAEAKRLNARMVRAQRAAPDDDSTLRAVAPILREGIPFQRKRVREFLAIKAPPEDREIIGEYQDLATQQTTIVARLASAAEDGEADRFSTFAAEQEKLSERSEGIAKGYGFKECGNGSNEAK